MSQQPFGDIPLFREIQRLLASGSGPINLEIARQIGIALATEGAAEAGPSPDDERPLREAVAAAEMVLAGYTRLPLEEPARVKLLTKSAWVSVTLEGWRWLLEHVAQHFMRQLTPGEGEGEANPLQAALDQVAPLLIGIQAGTLVGQLANETLDRYDLPIPRDDDGMPFFVYPNVVATAEDYGFDRDAFAAYLALHSTARYLVGIAAPWTTRYLRSLLTAIVDTLEIDLADLEGKLTELQAGGPEALGQPGAAPLPVVQTEQHRRALDRLQAFLAAFHGYADHACDAVAAQTIGDVARLDEGMTRRRATSSPGKTALASLLGITFDRTLESAGKTFAAAVVDRRGIAALNRLWDAPDNLPVLAEIKDPFAWMERVLDAPD